MAGTHVAYHDPTTPGIRIGCPTLKLYEGSRGTAFNPACGLHAGKTAGRINRSAAV